jgi:uncharacterized protein (DUF305 family)
MPSTKVRLTAALAVLVSSAVIGGCGTAPSGTTAPTRAPELPSPIHNADDSAFVQHMIPHHQQALDMTVMVPAHTSDPRLRTFAVRISRGQKAEIEVMNGFLARWGEPLANGGRGAMDMTGMVDETTMRQLPTLTGADFDTHWIEAMISHHRGAVAMAQTELARGQNPDATRLAQAIVMTQQVEITQMTDLISTSQ